MGAKGEHLRLDRICYQLTERLREGTDMKLTFF